MKIIEFDRLLDFPAFVNFRESLNEELNSDPDYTILRIKLINEKLKEFNAKYIWNGNNPARIDSIIDPAKKYNLRTIIFETEENYIHFCLKWN